MKDYKPHLACFKCRKTFKRKHLRDLEDLSVENPLESKSAKCPDCGTLMADMGMDFKSPPKDDLKAWKRIQDLFEIGETFHSCGCGGPGYRPRDEAQMKEHLIGIRKEYTQTLEAWKKEKPSEEKAAAVAFWIDRVARVNEAMERRS